MNDHQEEGADAPSPDRRQWESQLARWREAENAFVSDAAEGVRAADRLFLELTGAGEGSPAVVVRDLLVKREYSLGSTPTAAVFGTDPNPLEALVDLKRGIQESVHFARKGQAAARGIRAAREHRSASGDDFREAMELYRGEFSKRLGVKPDELTALVSSSPTAGTSLPDAQRSGAADDQALRELAIARKLVQESMIPLEQAEARLDRRRMARFAMIQLIGSVAVGLILLAVVIWVLSL